MVLVFPEIQLLHMQIAGGNWRVSLRGNYPAGRIERNSTYGQEKRNNDMPPFFQRDSPVLLFVSAGSSRNHHSDSGRSIEDSPIFWLLYLF